MRADLLLRGCSDCFFGRAGAVRLGQAPSGEDSDMLPKAETVGRLRSEGGSIRLSSGPPPSLALSVTEPGPRPSRPAGHRGAAEHPCSVSCSVALYGREGVRLGEKRLDAPVSLRHGTQPGSGMATSATGCGAGADGLPARRTRRRRWRSGRGSGGDEPWSRARSDRPYRFAVVAPAVIGGPTNWRWPRPAEFAASSQTSGRSAPDSPSDSRASASKSTSPSESRRG